MSGYRPGAATAARDAAEAAARAAVSGDRSLNCGCRYVEAAGKWYQVVACPDHELDFAPLDGPPA